uniref:Expansin-like EG45 domain-containing protein n=1 Tax=Araucaria cunninghamii TaxID=56994 RepID=A0A0D6QS26_ARACU
MDSSVIVGRLILLVYVVLLLVSLSSAENSYCTSRATYYGSPDCLGTAGGACGYGSFGRNLNGGDVAAVAQLYRNGTGCGACYQVRCIDAGLCSDEGIKIVVTDYGQGDRTDFILSSHGYSQLALSGKTKDLISMGVVDVEYKRISCQYPGYNLMLMIDESSNFPDYLALQFRYQAGQQDVLAVELCQEQSYEWKAMCRSHGAVWDVVTPPKGALSVRFLVSDGNSQEWKSAGNVIPPNWQAGALYDSGIQMDS